MKFISKKIILFIFISAFMAVDFGSGAFLARADEDVNKAKKSLEKTQAELEKEQKELQQSQANLSVTQGQINNTASQLNKTKEEISRKESELENIEKRIELNKKTMVAYAQEMYMNDSGISWTLSLSNVKFNEYFENFDQMLNLKEKILIAVEDIKKDKNKLEEVKGELAEKKEEHEDLLAVKQSEKNEIVGDIVESQATIGELQKKLAELQSDLSRILGKSYSTKDIKDAIKFANNITGVRKGFLFGMLSYESGGNPEAGNCTLKNCSMNSTRKGYFEKICDELDYSDKECKKRPVSCASPNYPGTGGAMGAAQFMSDTWWGYKDDIADATGNNPPNPWDLLDGVVAMALKLKDDDATEKGEVRITVPRAKDSKQYRDYPKCSAPSGTQKKAYVKWEIYASMRYLGWSCYGYAVYAPGIQSLAKGYDKL